jgi:pimeloyl-ACP methyl ester carboxylesterase
MKPMTAHDLAFDDEGAGPAVVLVHGHPFRRSMWAPQVAALREDYRVITPDLRGYGASPVVPGTVTMAELAQDVAGLLDRIGVGPAAVAGLSMGGLVAMELAIASPGRWWALGLVATTAEPVTEAERASRRERAALAESEGMRPLARDMASRLYGPGADPAVTSAVMGMMLATSPAGAAAALRGRAERPDYRPLLAALDIPAFVCVGDEDYFSNDRVTAELVSSLKQPAVTVLPGAGHLPNLEQPGPFNEALLAFLAAHRP